MKIVFLTCVLMCAVTSSTLAASVHASITLAHHGEEFAGKFDGEPSGFVSQSDPMTTEAFPVFNVELSGLAPLWADVSVFSFPRRPRPSDTFFSRISNKEVVNEVEILSRELTFSNVGPSTEGASAFVPYLSGIESGVDRSVLSEVSSVDGSDQDRRLLISCGLVTMILLRRYVVSQGKR